MHETTTPMGVAPDLSLMDVDHQSVPKLLFSREDAAFALSLSVRSIDYLIGAGKIQVRRIGKRVLIPATEVLGFAHADHSCLTQHGPQLLVA